MQLEKNMYVRTKYGITQYREYEINNCGLLSKIICMPVKCCNEGIFANTEDIVKASHDIIDLIEEGDYVNGYRVSTIDYENRTLYREYDDDFYFSICKEKDIHTIVTKEQFESMSYKVGE